MLSACGTKALQQLRPAGLLLLIPLLQGLLPPKTLTALATATKAAAATAGADDTLAFFTTPLLGSYLG